MKGMTLGSLNYCCEAGHKIGNERSRQIVEYGHVLASHGEKSRHQKSIKPPTFSKVWETYLNEHKPTEGTRVDNDING